MGKRNKPRTTYVPLSLAEENEQETTAGAPDSMPSNLQPVIVLGSLLDELEIEESTGLAICPVNRDHKVKHTKLMHHVKKCAKAEGAHSCRYNFHHIFFDKKSLKEHEEQCPERPVNEFPPPTPAQLNEIASARALRKNDQTGSGENSSNAGGASNDPPDFMGNPRFRSMLMPHVRPKRSGMSKTERNMWERGEKGRVAAIVNREELTQSVCDDCQIPDFVMKYYNSTLPPRAAVPYIPVGMSAPQVVESRPQNKQKAKQKVERVVPPEEPYVAPRESSQASGTVEDCPWLKVKDARRRKK